MLSRAKNEIKKLILVLDIWLWLLGKGSFFILAIFYFPNSYENIALWNGLKNKRWLQNYGKYLAHVNKSDSITMNNEPNSKS